MRQFIINHRLDNAHLTSEANCKLLGVREASCAEDAPQAHAFHGAKHMQLQSSYVVSVLEGLTGLGGQLCLPSRPGEASEGLGVV